MNDYDFLVYTDGACIGNPGPGGWAAIIRDRKGHERVVSGSARSTTNNRMELRAALEALRQLPVGKQVRVLLRADSRHLVDAITKGWAARWRQQGWKRNRHERAENTDLWAQLLDELERRTVVVEWTKAHNGDPLNERCDAIARNEAEHATGTDEGYVRRHKQLPLEHQPLAMHCTRAADGSVTISVEGSSVTIPAASVPDLIRTLSELSSG
ncbi:MAG: ribonuclease HI [Chlorobi bacterium]|nr:ribonuclease HI [Chlorobiota bacterium]